MDDCVCVYNALLLSASGTIDFEEFLVMMVQQLKEDQAGKTEDELSEIFRVFDKYVTRGHHTHTNAHHH